MALGEASVRILPDVSDFEKNLLAAVQSAMSAAQGAVDDAASGITGAFDGAASEANAALASVTGDDFSGAVGAADVAAGEVAGAMDGAASEADAALSAVDGEGFTEATTAADKAGDKIAESMQDAAQKTENAFRQVNLEKAFGGVLAGAAVIGFTKAIIGAAEEAQVSSARIDQIAISMGLFGDQTLAVTQRIKDYASATAEQVGIDDDAIMMAQAKLLTFKDLAATAGETGGAFDRATQAALDLSVVFGSADSAALQLGKALQDPVKGMTALTRSGVTFTEVEKERIRTLVESNQLGEAQRLILEAIEMQVGGTAEATATSSGKMLVAFDSLQESLGAALLPALESVVGILGTAVDFFVALPEPIQKVVTITGLAAAGFYAASRALQGLGLAAGAANKSLGAIGVVLTAAIGIYSVYAGRKKEAEQRTLELADALLLEGAAQNEALAALAQNDDATRRFLESAKELGITIEDVAQYAKEGTGPLADLAAAADGITSSVQGTYPELAALSEELLGVTLVGDSFTEKAKNMTQEQILAAAAVRDFFPQLQLLRQGELDAAEAAELVTLVTREQATAAGEAATSTDLLGISLDTEQQAAADAEAALRTLLDATLSMFNSQLGLESATFRTTDSVNEYNRILMETTAGIYEGDDAARALAEAQNTAAGSALSQAAAAARLAEDQALASGATFTAADSARVQRDELQRVADTLAPNSPLRRLLLGYIDDLNNKIPREIETKLNAIINIRANALSSNFGGLIPRFAEGGIFDSARVGMIAEAGAEAVIPISKPQRAMELLELSGLADMVRGSGGGAMVNIQQATFASATDADLVAQRLNTALRVRGFAR